MEFKSNKRKFLGFLGAGLIGTFITNKLSANSKSENKIESLDKPAKGSKGINLQINPNAVKRVKPRTIK